MITNPIVARLIPAKKLRSLRVIVWIAAVLFAVCLAVSIRDLWCTINTSTPSINPATVPFANGPILYGPFLRLLVPTQGSISAWLVLPIWALAVIVPPLVGVTAAIQTGRDAASEAYSLLKLTLITPAEMVRGYITAALLRIGVPVALLVGLAPVLTLGSANFGLFMLLYQVFSMHPATFMPQMQLTFADVWMTLFGSILIGAGFLIAPISAAALGVWVGLSLKDPGRAVAVTAPLYLIGSLAGAVLMLIAYGPLLGGSGFAQFPREVLIEAVTAALCLAVPVAVWLGARRLARRAV